MREVCEGTQLHLKAPYITRNISEPQIRVCPSGHRWAIRRVNETTDRSGGMRSFTTGGLSCPVCGQRAKISMTLDESDEYTEYMEYKKMGMSDDKILVVMVIKDNLSPDLIRDCIKRYKE
jgi:hypothetical protein